MPSYNATRIKARTPQLQMAARNSRNARSLPAPHVAVWELSQTSMDSMSCSLIALTVLLSLSRGLKSSSSLMLVFLRFAELVGVLETVAFFGVVLGVPLGLLRVGAADPFSPPIPPAVLTRRLMFLMCSSRALGVGRASSTEPEERQLTILRHSRRSA